MNAKTKILTAAQVSELLGVSRETVYRLTRTNKIPYFKIGTALRFSEKSIEEWIKVDLSERKE